MKPITSILLVLALICYIFLPLYEISFQGTITGFSFTAGSITQYPSVRHIAFALLPFISCFLAIGFNTLKNRWWGLLAAFFILGMLWFFSHTYNFHEIALQHQPDVMPNEDIGEGFTIVGLGIGFKASCVITILALVSALLSVLPFSFNQTIEKAVDNTIDRSLDDVRAIGSKVSKDVKDWQSKHHKPNKSRAESPVSPDQGVTNPDDGESHLKEIDKEDPSRFMPK